MADELFFTTGIFPLIFALALGILFVFAFRAVKGERKRTRQIGEESGKLGFGFSGNPEKGFLRVFLNFGLFTRGYSKTAKNAVKGPETESSSLCLTALTPNTWEAAAGQPARWQRGSRQSFTRR